MEKTYTPEEQKAIDLMVTMSMHLDGFHTKIVGYGYTETGEKVLTKTVNRRNYDCPKCEEQYGKPSPMEFQK